MNTVPGNPRVLNKLREVLKSNNAIAFVGAGASAGLYPLWSGLISMLADEAVARGFANEADRDLWLRKTTKPQQAVRGIKQKLGDPTFGHVLREIFRPKIGPDGNYFTPIHAAVVQLPFRGLVTTNYDAGLVEARLKLRGDIRNTGWATWKDSDSVQRWLTGEVFEEELMPILFAHGSYQRSETIVLGTGDYRDAYKPGPYRRLFEKLWAQERLIFVGFGFSDTWLEFLAEDVITQTSAQAAGEPRHIAIIGLPGDVKYTPEHRRIFHDQYNADVYFIP
jgi:hypothetical protein